MAGQDDDLRTAKDLLALFQSEFGISSPESSIPIYDAGSPASRKATTDLKHLTAPTAWIDTYYPVLNAPTGQSSLEIVDEEGKTVWTADLAEHVPEDADPIEFKYANAIPPFHGLSKNGTAEVCAVT